MNNKALLLFLTIVVFSTAGNHNGLNARNKLQKISVRQAIETAKKNNLDYMIAIKKLKAQSEKVNEIWGQLLPVIETEASLARNDADMGMLSITEGQYDICLLYTSPSPRDVEESRMPSSA